LGRGFWQCHGVFGSFLVSAARFYLAQEYLSEFAAKAGLDASSDPVVIAVIEEARARFFSFATSAWIPLSPDLVYGVESVLRDLADGVTLGEARAAARTASLAIPSLPSASQSSVSSSVVAPPMSATPSGSSGKTGPLFLESDSGDAVRPKRPLPRNLSRRVRVSSPDDAPSTSTATVVAPRIVLPTPVAPVASSADVAPATTPAPLARSRKRAGSGLSPVRRPAKWPVCARCKSRKKGCTPSEGADPPSCKACVKDKVLCVPYTESAGK
jgi:hypothetical protein